MNINKVQNGRMGLMQNASLANQKKGEMAQEFEKLFARQLVQEMTKGLFKNDDNQGMMKSGNGMYRKQVVYTLSEALAKQGTLGMADMVSRHWNLPTEVAATNIESNTE